MRKYKIVENGTEYDIQEYSEGDKHWYLNGYNMKKYKIIEDGIEYEVKEYSKGDKDWFLNGYKHWILNSYICRVEHSSGYKAWYKNNKRHREDGPALILKSGAEEYWLNGKWYPDISSDEELLLASIIT